MDAESGRGPTPATPDAECASSRLRRRREAEASGAERPVRSRGGVESSRRVRRADEVEWLGMVRIGSIVLRVRDLRLQAEFWAAALDYVPREEQSDDFLLLRPRTGVGPNLSLDLHHSTAHLPPRIHLDLYTDDQVGEIGRLLALGATEVPWDKRPPDADYVILADPEGNRFCVVDAQQKGPV